MLWTRMYKYLFKFPLLILLDIYPEVESLDHMVILCLIFWEATIPFSTEAAQFYIRNSNARGSDFSTSSPTLVIFWFSFNNILKFQNNFKKFSTAYLIYYKSLKMSWNSQYFQISLPWKAAGA